MRVKHIARSLSRSQIHVEGHADIALVTDEHLAGIVHRHLRTENFAGAVDIADSERLLPPLIGIGTDHLSRKAEISFQDILTLLIGNERRGFGDIAVEFILNLEFDDILAEIIRPYAILPAPFPAVDLLIIIGETDVVEIETAYEIHTVFAVRVVTHKAQRAAAKLIIIRVGDSVFQLMSQFVSFVMQIFISPALSYMD